MNCAMLISALYVLRTLPFRIASVCIFKKNSLRCKNAFIEYKLINLHGFQIVTIVLFFSEKGFERQF